MTNKAPLIAIWIVLSVVLIVRCWAMAALHDGLHQDPDQYRKLAQRLQADRGFLFESKALSADGCEVLSGEYIAFRPPLYPWLLSHVVPAHSPNFAIWIGAIQVVLGLATIGITFAVGRRFGLQRKTASLAALAVLFDPLLIRQSAEVMTETLATFLALSALWGLAAADRAGVKAAFLTGILLGGCALCRPTLLLWAILITLFLAINDLFKRYAIDRMSGLVVGIVLAMLPWGVRNWMHFKQPVWTTTHGGYTLYRANNPWYYEHLRASTWGTVWATDAFDSHWYSISNRTRGYDFTWLELENDRIAYSAASSAIVEDPGIFAYASLVRLTRLYGMLPWQIDPNEAWRTRWLRYSIGVFYLVEFALAIAGVVTLGRQLLRPPWVWGALLVLSFTLVHTFYWTDMRMRAPLVPVIALVAAVGAGRLRTGIAKLRCDSPHRHQTVCA